MAQKITNKTTDLQIGTVLKVINIKENTPFILNKFYNITEGDGVGALFVGGYSDVELTMHELGNYFEHVSTLDDIVDLESKALLIKQIFNQFKELSEDAEEEKSKAKILNNLHNGEIMLLHGNSKTNTNILDSIIKEAKQMGYEFKSLDEFQN